MDKSEHCKDVYAHYGLAMYLAQCVEQSIFQMIMMFDFFPKNVPKKLPFESWVAEFDGFDSLMSKKTMGQVIGKLKTLNVLNENAENMLQESLKRRNELAHRFFVDHGLSFVSELGREKMIRELQEHQKHFEKMEDSLVPIVKSVMDKYGFTEDMLRKAEEELFEESKNDL